MISTLAAFATTALHLTCLLLFTAVLTTDAYGQILSTCKDGSLGELEASISAHNEHVYRMDRKFKDIWYYQGRVPQEISNEVTAWTIERYLRKLLPRKTAILFHAANEGKLCTWLITLERRIVGCPRILSAQDWERLRPWRWQELGVRAARKPRVANPGDLQPPLDEERSEAGWNELLAALSTLLFPDQVVDELVRTKTDTLIVVPVSIREAGPEHKSEIGRVTKIRDENYLRGLPMADRFVLSIGTVPFFALPIRGKQLLDRMSVVVAPGFFIFGRDPDAARSRFEAPIIVGDPEHARLQPLPGARQEVKSVAAQLQTEALFGEAARKRDVMTLLRSQCERTDFILLSTHGSASESDPVDGSYLSFSDEPLKAREVSALREQIRPQGRNKQYEMDRPLLRQRPLVIMSACETALGKDFAVGTIGLARAWQWAGASKVVMSLWSVDDEATRDLIVNFVELILSGKPADKALQEAAVNARRIHINPAYWAAFSLFGAPETAPGNQGR